MQRRSPAARGRRTRLGVVLLTCLLAGCTAGPAAEEGALPLPATGRANPGRGAAVPARPVPALPAPAFPTAGSSVLPAGPPAALAAVSPLPLPAVAPAAAPGLPAPAAGPRPPSVVLVLTDDLSSDLLAAMPTVQQMQREGTSFSRYVVTDSLCCPSRASLFTGRFPHDTGVFTNVGRQGGFPVFRDRGEEFSTFATDLQAAGYRTGLLGKYLNQYQPGGGSGQAPNYVPPGWDEWAVGGDAYPEFNYLLATHRGLLSYGNAPQDYLTDVLAARGERFIADAAAAARPFFLEVSTFAPHSPFVPAPRDAQSFRGAQAPRTPSFDVRSGPDAPRWLQGRAPRTPADIAVLDKDFRRREQSVQAVDALLARLRIVLAQTGRAQDTYVIFTSDNGFHLGQHRLMAGKNTAFDTDIRVPLVVTGPGVPAGADVGQLVSGVDVRPTLDEIAGVPAPPEVDGVSLLSLLRGQPPPTWRDAVLVEHNGPVVDRADPDLPALGSGNPGSYVAIRTLAETWVEYADGEVEHYDIASDPDQLHPTASDVPLGRRAQLRATLAALVACHGADSCWRAARLGR